MRGGAHPDPRSLLASPSSWIGKLQIQQDTISKNKVERNSQRSLILSWVHTCTHMYTYTHTLNDKTEWQVLLETKGYDQYAESCWHANTQHHVLPRSTVNTDETTAQPGPWLCKELQQPSHPVPLDRLSVPQLSTGQFCYPWFRPEGSHSGK